MGEEDGALSSIRAVERAGSLPLHGKGYSRRQPVPRLTLEKQEMKLLVLFASLWRALERDALQERRGQNWWRRGRF